MATKFFQLTITGTDTVFSARLELSKRQVALKQLIAAGVDVQTVRQELTIAKPRARQKMFQQLAGLISVKE